MSSCSRLAFLTLAFVVPNLVAAAELTSTQVTQTRQADSSIEANTLSSTDMVRARVWDLSETEWHRYKQLMQGIRGSISPSTISPIEVLGIHSRDEIERQKYAEIWARTMREDVGRILAFQRAYDAAGKRLYPNESLIDISRLPGKTKVTSDFQSTDRLLFFTRLDCPACDALMSILLKSVDKVSGIDIYLMDMEPGDDTGVREWASSHQIDPEWVRSRRITLNHDGGALAKLTNGQGYAPYVLRRRGEKLSQIQASDL